MQILTVIALIIIGVFLFEFIIFAHEFGHFITAKLSGVKVNEFSLGMGPRLFGLKKGETEYSLRLFPIGGYCAMEGEDEESNEPRSFNNAKIWKRMIIIIAGAVMNIILGLLLMFIYVASANANSAVFSSTTVSRFELGSYSAACGLEAGDKIVNINGYSVNNANDLSFGISTLPCEKFNGSSIEVYRQDCAYSLRKLYVELINEYNPVDEEKEELYNEVCEFSSEIYVAKDKSQAKTILDDACKQMYAYFNVNDFTLPQIEEKSERYRYAGDVTVIRNGKKLKLEDVQFYTYYASDEAKENDQKSVGIDFYVEPIEKNVGSVITQTFSMTGSMAKVVWTSLVWLVQGKFSFTDLSGPVGVATTVTQVASEGLQISFLSAVTNILYVMILITINLGIFNMLPFPALDGGKFVFLLIEWIFRKPIPRKIEQIVNSVGLIILMLFMLVVSMKDVWQLFTGTMFS